MTDFWFWARAKSQSGLNKSKKTDLRWEVCFLGYRISDRTAGSSEKLRMRLTGWSTVPMP